MKCFTTIILFVVSISTYGQQKFSIKLNQKTIGSSIITYTQTTLGYTTDLSNHIRFITLEDTTSISSQITFSETDNGKLIDVKSIFKESKLKKFEKHYTYNGSSPLGPVGIQKLSKRSLQKVGDTISFLNFSPDLNQLVKTYRKVTQKKFINGQIIWSTSDSTGLLPLVFNDFNHEFELLSSQTTTSLGLVRIEQYQQPLDSVLAVYEQSIKHPNIHADIILPDPKKIKGLSLKVYYADSTHEINITDNIFTPLPSDSLEILEAKSSNQWVRSDDLDLFSLTDSLTAHLDSELSMACALTNHCKEHIYSYPSLQLITMARSIFMLSRLVYGYRYTNGQWFFHHWCEIGVYGEWKLFDPSSTNPNTSLYLPIGKTYLNEGFTKLSTSPTPTAIEIKGYLLGNRIYKNINETAFTLENRVLAIPGIGFKMYLLEEFNINSIFDDKNTLLTLQNEKQSSISISYVSQDTLSYETINTVLNDFIPNSETTNIDHFKFEHYLRASDKKAILIIKQEENYIEIRATYLSDKIEYLFGKNTIRLNRY